MLLGGLTGRARRSTPGIYVLFWSAPDGAIPGRPCPQGFKAPSARRRERHPTGDRVDRRASQRRHPTAVADRRLKGSLLVSRVVWTLINGLCMCGSGGYGLLVPIRTE